MWGDKTRTSLRGGLEPQGKFLLENALFGLCAEQTGVLSHVSQTGSEGEASIRWAISVIFEKK